MNSATQVEPLTDERIAAAFYEKDAEGNWATGGCNMEGFKRAVRWTEARHRECATFEPKAEAPRLATTVPIEEYRRLLARCIELGEKIAFRKGVSLDANETQYLAARLRRLFAHFGLSLPEGHKDDARLIGIAGAAIGMLLTRWECGDPQPAAWVNGEELHGKANATIACGAERREVKGGSYDTPLYLAAPTAPTGAQA